MLINFNMRPPEDGKPDERYKLNPPKGVCKNKYCPEPPSRHDKMVRGYCETCASIRVPPSEYKPAKRMKPDDWDTISNIIHQP